MGSLHNELRRTQFSTALKNFLGDTRSESGIERYGETLTPIIDMLVEGEINFLREETLFEGVVNATAVAGEEGYVGIGLPVFSKDLLIVERVNARGAATQSVVIGFSTRAVVAPTLTLTSTMRNRDQRAAASGLTLLNLGARIEAWSGTDPAALISNSEEILCTDTAFREFIGGPWIIKPGGVLLVTNLTLNAFVGANFAGRVRAARTGELVNV